MKCLFIISALCTIYYLILKWAHHLVAFSRYFLYAGVIGMMISLFELYGPFSLFFWIPAPLSRVIVFFMGLFVLGFLLFLFLSLSEQHHPFSIKPDVIFVFGAGLFQDRLSLSLSTRLNKALELANCYPEAIIIVAGGQGPDEWVSEAWAMKQYLLDHGIDEQRILMEDQSTSTYENLAYAKHLYDFHHKKTALVSNPYHLYRAKKIAQKMGIDGFGVGAPIQTIASGVFYVREYLALIKGIIFHEI